MVTLCSIVQFYSRIPFFAENGKIIYFNKNKIQTSFEKMLSCKIERKAEILASCKVSNWKFVEPGFKPRSARMVARTTLSLNQSQNLKHNNIII